MSNDQIYSTGDSVDVAMRHLPQLYWRPFENIRRHLAEGNRAKALAVFNELPERILNQYAAYHYLKDDLLRENDSFQPVRGDSMLQRIMNGHADNPHNAKAPTLAKATSIVERGIDAEYEKALSAESDPLDLIQGVSMVERAARASQGS